MEIIGKKISVYRTHEQKEEDKEHDAYVIDYRNGEIIAISEDGKMLVPYPTLVKVDMSETVIFEDIKTPYRANLMKAKLRIKFDNFFKNYKKDGIK